MKKQITKTTKVLSVITIALFLNNYIYGQGHWVTGAGNLSFGIDGVSVGNNFIGTAISNPVPVILGASGNNPQMTLDITGNVGIGTAVVTPVYQLDVDKEINVSQYSTMGSYKINGKTVLHNIGSINICVGENAGLSLSTGFANAFVGYNAGVNTDGYGNTYIGAWAGVNSTNDIFNTYIGLQSGALTVGGSSNTFVGHDCGYNNISGNYNAFVGDEAGGGNSTGNFNSCFGVRSGFQNTIGRLNTFIGYNANIPGAAVVNNSAAIGANAIVMSNNTMILGDNNVSVGIGMSSAIPTAKLHVNRVPSSFVAALPVAERIENSEIATGVV